MKNLTELKALYALLTGKTSTAKTIAGVIKEIKDGLTVSIDDSTHVLTISVTQD